MAWLASKDRNAITHAVAESEKHLAIRPLELGESRESSVQRVAFWPPIAIEYDVSADDNRVVVPGLFLAG
ncbi:MAG: hypothetical protein EXS09_02740 [Gemmataceae bacterium]|nr:hypothetical protein [Gemmataceae bacterium]